jgi:cytochrome c oxidase assembly protein subunit 15
MVKSGLEPLESPDAVPRVSQYRLAAHLGTAFLLYVGMFWNGMALIKDSKYANGKPWSGLATTGTEAVEKMCQKILADPKVRNFKRLSLALTGLVFVTALSGIVLFTLAQLHDSLILQSRRLRCWS